MRSVFELVDDFLERLFEGSIGSRKLEEEQFSSAATAQSLYRRDASGRESVTTLGTDHPVKLLNRAPTNLANDARGKALDYTAAQDATCREKQSNQGLEKCAESLSGALQIIGGGQKTGY